MKTKGKPHSPDRTQRSPSPKKATFAEKTEVQDKKEEEEKDSHRQIHKRIIIL